MNVWIWTILGFFAGSIPFSMGISKLVAKRDIRTIADGNPGSMNVGKVLGWRWFLIALLLDALKGFIPVGFAYFRGEMDGWQLFPIVLAPVLGHAFSPWLKFRGGKAVATTFGVWFGLILWNAGFILGAALLLMVKIVKGSGWALMAAFSLFGIFLALFYFPDHSEWLYIWLGNALIFIIKHWQELGETPSLQPWLLKRLKQQ